MNGVSIAVSILSKATAGAQVSTKMATLSTQISTASARVSSIRNDVSITSGTLHLLGELMTTVSDGISGLARGFGHYSHISGCVRLDHQ